MKQCTSMSTATTVDQQIFQCSSVAKSLLYSSELSCRYCVCTHSLEHNLILRSNPQAEQSKRALLPYSAKLYWGGWRGFYSLPCTAWRVNARWKQVDVFTTSIIMVETHTRVKHSARFQGHMWRKGCGRTLLEFWLAGFCCMLSRKHLGPHWAQAHMMHANTHTLISRHMVD